MAEKKIKAIINGKMITLSEAAFKIAKRFYNATSEEELRAAKPVELQKPLIKPTMKPVIIKPPLKEPLMKEPPVVGDPMTEKVTAAEVTGPPVIERPTVKKVTAKKAPVKSKTK